MQGILGILVFLGLAWLFSEGRREVRFVPVAAGLAIQFAIAFALLRLPIARDGLLVLNHAIEALETATTAGASLVFGFLGGGETPFALTAETAPYIFAFRILPQILVFSVLVALLWHWRVLPVVIRGFSWALRRSLGVGGAVGLAASASVFLGMVEAPLAIRAHLARLSRSELFVVMTCGMSTVAGSIMVLYANLLVDVIDGALGHVLVASVVNVVGAVVVARMMIPESGVAAGEGEGEGEGEGDGEGERERTGEGLSYASVMDAISRGTADGLRLVVNVGAMAIVLVSLVALLNHVLSGLTIAGDAVTLQRMAGWAFAPVAWLMGIEWAEASFAGTLLGVKVVLNELIAYIQLGDAGPGEIGERTRLILTYGLCGFTNFGSVGILIGGLSALVPERRAEVLRLAPRTLVSGTIVACITGAIAGLVTS